MSNKTLMGGIAGGLASFLLGWLIYGILLRDFTATNFNNSIMRPGEGMIWWALILSNLLGGYFIALVFSWSNVSGMMPGLTRGAIIGLLVAAGFDLSMYSMSTMFLNSNAMVVDIVVSTVMYAITGGVVGSVMGMNQAKKEA